MIGFGKVKQKMISPLSYHPGTTRKLNERLGMHARSQHPSAMIEKQWEWNIRFPVMMEGWSKNSMAYINSNLIF